MPTFQDKVVFITGADGAIGRAMAVLYAERGAKLFLTDLKTDALHALA